MATRKHPSDCLRLLRPGTVCRKATRRVSFVLVLFSLFALTLRPNSAFGAGPPRPRQNQSEGSETAQVQEASKQINNTVQPAKSVNPLLLGVAAWGPADAPVTVIEFADFECSFCSKVAPVFRELLRAYPDQIRLIFKHTPLSIHLNAPLAHEAAQAAAAQGKFWEMHDLLFANQNRLQLDDLVRYAQQLHLDLAAFHGALTSRVYRPLIEQELTEAKGLGVIATPTFFINGKKLVGARSFSEFKAIIDEELGVTKQRARTEEESDDGSPVDLRQMNLARSPVKGPPAAPVTIVEFSDFQCPYCARAVPTLKELLGQYPDQIKWVFKNYPLDFHPDSPLAHQAALAAAEQGKFWEMHDRIFANQNAMKREDLLGAARALGLAMDRFLADLDSKRFKAVVEADKGEAARLGVSGTPTFFINGRRLIGALPLDEFKKLIERELTVASKDPKEVAGDKAVQPVFAKGPSQAPVTIVWFSDLQSALTPKAAQLTQQLMDAYPGQVRLIFKNLPLDFHPEAALAHEAALAAGAQGKFWEMHDLIVANQMAMKKEDLIRYADRLGLAREPFVVALDGRTYRPSVEKDLAEARRREVRGTPAFFVNEKRIDGVQPLAVFKEIIEAELKKVKSGGG